MRQYFCLNWVLIDNLFDRSRDDQAKICWPATVKKLFWTGSIDQVHKKHGPREECSDMGRGNRTVFCTMYVNTVLVALRKQTFEIKRYTGWQGSHTCGQNTKNNFAEFVHCVQTKISVPSEGKCFCFCTPARPRMGRGEGTSDFKWQGRSHGGKTQNPIKSL